MKATLLLLGLLIPVLTPRPATAATLELVAGTGEGLDPADELGVANGIRMDPKSVCDFCRFDLICGRGLTAAPIDDDEGGPDAG